jgi:hypothetical protein
MLLASRVARPISVTVPQRGSEGPGAHHVVSENASQTEPARMIAVIVADDGDTLTTFDK